MVVVVVVVVCCGWLLVVCCWLCVVVVVVVVVAAAAGVVVSVWAFNVCMSTLPTYATTVTETNGAHHLCGELQAPLLIIMQTASHVQLVEIPDVCASNACMGNNLRHRLSTLVHSA